MISSSGISSFSTMSQEVFLDLLTALASMPSVAIRHCTICNTAGPSPQRQKIRWETKSSQVLQNNSCNNNPQTFP